MKWIELMIMPTSRCPYGCWYCLCNSTSCGQDLDLGKFWELKEILYSEQVYENYAVGEVLFTGGGEPLLYPDLPRIVAGAALLGPREIVIKTAGFESEVAKENFLETRKRLQEAASGFVRIDSETTLDIDPVHYFLEVSVDESMASRQRCSNVLGTGVDVSLVYHQDRRKGGKQRLEEYVDFRNWLESMGFSPELLGPDRSEAWMIDFVQPFILNGEEQEEIADIMEEFFVKILRNESGQKVILYPFSFIQARGRAEMPMRRWYKKFPSYSGPLCDMVLEKDTVHLSMDWQGKIGLCHCGKRDHDHTDLVHLLENHDHLREEVACSLISTTKQIEWICDPCPLRENRPKSCVV